MSRPLRKITVTLQARWYPEQKRGFANVQWVDAIDGKLPEELGGSYLLDAAEATSELTTWVAAIIEACGRLLVWYIERDDPVQILLRADRMGFEHLIHARGYTGQLADAIQQFRVLCLNTGRVRLQYRSQNMSTEKRQALEDAYYDVFLTALQREAQKGAA